MDIRAPQDKPDRGRVLPERKMRAMKEVRALDQAPQRGAGERVMEGSVEAYLVDKRAPAGAAVQGMQSPVAGKHVSSSNAVMQAGSTVDTVQRVAAPGNQQVHFGMAAAPVHVHVVKEAYPVPEPQPHVIVENDVLKVEEVKGPDHPKQKGIEEYLEEGTIKPEAGDQVVYRLKPVGGDSSAAALAEAGHITTGDPQLAVLGSPEVPVGVASALSYMQLGQTAKVKLAEQLLTHVAGDTEAGFQPLPEDIASSAHDKSYERPCNRWRDTSASPAGSTDGEKALQSGTGSTGEPHDVLPDPASQTQRHQQQLGPTHELQAVHRTAPASSTGVQQLPGRSTGAAPPPAPPAAAAAGDKDGYHTPNGSAFYTPLSITPAAGSGSSSSLDNQAVSLSFPGQSTSGLILEQAGSSSSSYRMSGGGKGGTYPMPPGSTGSTCRVNGVLFPDSQHDSKVSQPLVTQAGVVRTREPDAVLKAAAAKLQQQYGSTTEQQQQQAADKLSVQRHVRQLEQQHSLGKGGLSPEQQQQQYSSSTTARSAADSTSNTSPAAATAAAAAAKVSQQQQPGYPEIEVLHKPVAPPAAPAAAAAVTGGSCSSKAVPEVAALGQDQGESSSSNSAWLKPVQHTAGNAAAAASSGVAAAAAARGGLDAPAPTAGWGTASIQAPLAAQQQQQQGAGRSVLPPTGNTTNNGSSTAIAASWGKAVGEQQQQQQQNLAQAGQLPHLGPDSTAAAAATQPSNPGPNTTAAAAAAVQPPNLGHAPDEPVKSDSPVIVQLPPRVNLRTGRPAAVSNAATGGPISSSAVQGAQGRSSASYDAQSIASFKAWFGRPSQTSEPHTPTHGAAAAAPAEILADGEHHTHHTQHKDCPLCGTAKDQDEAQQQQHDDAAAGGSSTAAAATGPAAASGDAAAVGDTASSTQDKAVEYEVELLAVIPGRGNLSGKPILAEAAKQQPPDVAALTKTAQPHLQPPKPRRGLTGWVRRHLSLNVRAPWKAGKSVVDMLGLRGCFRGAQDRQK